ncbi:MAG: MBL fold metallo-hydrolase, partial [Pseudomonadota bacterium]
VLHLPGHTPGSIGLWEADKNLLIGGDAIYDGLIIDTLDESSPADYRPTMERIAGLGAQIVHGGHRESFGPAKLRTIIDGYLASK